MIFSFIWFLLQSPGIRHPVYSGTGKTSNLFLLNRNDAFGGMLTERSSLGVDRMSPHREARIAGLSLAAVYALCLLLTAISMS
ncbi:hypothetical protein XH86_26900 [Bradyrhizobium guangdongense]|uniref:Uncharacterized protein n=1 Tax=Bradyrhizobium guangdongense TaxID=1325090 RepID=A0ABX6ULP2_9BRAD|nr:hypothetical protein X265_26875 [Bradyrhizobium guangdongense]QOZ61967.1 hypothetical protein XH86_26900 [Bradyrhizobium guangdongense]